MRLRLSALCTSSSRIVQPVCVCAERWTSAVAHGGCRCGVRTCECFDTPNCLGTHRSRAFTITFADTTRLKKHIKLVCERLAKGIRFQGCVESVGEVLCVRGGAVHASHRRQGTVAAGAAAGASARAAAGGER